MAGFMLTNAFILFQDSDACAEKDEEETDEREQVETLESREGFSAGDVREVLEEMTREMLGKLQVMTHV